jgi:pilus assembly protein Flp/PilA
MAVHIGHRWHRRKGHRLHQLLTGFVAMVQSTPCPGRHSGESCAAMRRKLRHDQRGATAIEYGLIAAIIAVAAIPMIQWMGDVNNQRVEKAAYGLGAPNTP